MPVESSQPVAASRIDLLRAGLTGQSDGSRLVDQLTESIRSEQHQAVRHALFQVQEPRMVNRGTIAWGSYANNVVIGIGTQRLLQGDGRCAEHTTYFAGIGIGNLLLQCQAKRVI